MTDNINLMCSSLKEEIFVSFVKFSTKISYVFHQFNFCQNCSKLLIVYFYVRFKVRLIFYTSDIFSKKNTLLKLVQNLRYHL